MRFKIVTIFSKGFLSLLSMTLTFTEEFIARWHIAYKTCSRLHKLLGKDDSKVTYKDAEPFTTRVRTPDSSKAKRDLGFKISVPLEEGMRRTVEWFKVVCGG